jgi:predicted AAA+ superfamily ATPase
MKKLTWYHKVGFFNNPFSIKPAAFHNELFGNSSTISRIIKKMSEPGIVFISGEFGTGKTTVLKKLIAEFRGGIFEGKKVIYYNCNQSEKSINYDKLLVDAGNFLGKLFRFRKKNMIILLDEMQDMNKKDMEQVKKYYDDGFFKLVVLVSKYENINLTKELENETNGNKFKLGNMTKNEAIRMVRERIGTLKFISDDIIVRIFSRDENSRSFLKNCEDVCRYAFEKGDGIVEEEHISKALG